MKVRVLKKFRDKETGGIRNAGTVFEATEERVAEIKAKDAGLIEVLTGESTDEESDIRQEQEQKAAGEVCDIAHASKKQLNELAKAKKVKGYTKMSADELREALKG